MHYSLINQVLEHLESQPKTTIDTTGGFTTVFKNMGSAYCPPGKKKKMEDAKKEDEQEPKKVAPAITALDHTPPALKEE